MESIINFCILAHIDHGKSTLADRFLELTKSVPQNKMRQQYLDTMDLEREKGITIKMAPVRMLYTLDAKPYTLNLIDTPGHVDFSYEVSRALVCVEGAVLLVDAAKGIQAQTIANFEQARKQNLTIIPVVNKIDLPQAKIGETKAEIANLLNVSEKEVLEISAKHGKGVETLLGTLVEKIPRAKLDREKPFRALIFDSEYDHYKGAVAYVRVFEGEIKTNEKIYLLSNKIEGIAKEIGFFNPEPFPQKILKAGEIGFIATGIKEPGRVRVGDTITSLRFTVQSLKLPESLPGYKEPKPMVFASMYPQDAQQYDLLKDGIAKLKLNDPALTFEPESKVGLGRGYLCGFLGNLHAEIIAERLRREFKINLIISSPQVLYKITNQKNQAILIHSPSDWPSSQEIKESKEPWVKLEIITPNNYLGGVLELLQNFGSKHVETKYFGQDKIILIYEAPLRVILSGFYDNLKGVSQGFASMNYEFLDYREVDLVKLEILIAGEKQEAFSKIVPSKEAENSGRKIVKKLKEILPAQLFSVPLQAAVSGKIIARETLRAKGKDVIAPLYGGDYTRKRKLLEKQKKGKKELKEKGKVRVPPKVFFELYKS